LENAMTLVSATLLLLFVMNPVGNAPRIHSTLRRVEPRRRAGILARELLIALALLVVFLFAGQILLVGFQLSPAALAAGGGVVLLLIAVRLIFPAPEFFMGGVPRDEPFIVPLAFPYAAGPAVLATELLLIGREPERWPLWLLAVGLAWTAAAAILSQSGRLRKLLGDRGTTAIERLTGLVLVLVAVGMLTSDVVRVLGDRTA
jgi:multiple antibiotic resistance protein